VGVPRKERWEEKLNSDSEHYGGSGQGNLGGVDAQSEPADDQPYSIALTVPALAAMFFEPAGKNRRRLSRPAKRERPPERST
jgi:1,4-alpha-glucan branching enzyme